MRLCAPRLHLEGSIPPHSGCTDGAREWKSDGAPSRVPSTIGPMKRVHPSPFALRSTSPHDTEPDIIYVFATKGGATTNPDWYHNLTAAGEGSVERGPRHTR